MRARTIVAVTVALALPSLTRAQHSHGGGGGGMDMPPARHDKHKAPEPERQRGVLPPGSPRQVQVLVVYFGFSPKEIPADQGEEIVLAIRRSSEAHCKAGLAIPSRKVHVQLPVGETIPVTLKLDRAETIVLACADAEDVKASIVVAPR